jgi:nicotinamidase-related amidase
MLEKSSHLQLDPLKTALLVIDVQRALFTRSTPIYMANKLIQNINALVQKFRRAGSTVIYV